MCFVDIKNIHSDYDLEEETSDEEKERAVEGRLQGRYPWDISSHSHQDAIAMQTDAT